MQSKDTFGDIRSRLHHPTASNWQTITQWVRRWPDARERDEVILPYCIAQLRAWPDHLRVAEDVWFERFIAGDGERGAWRAIYSLARRITFSNDTIALKSWRQLLDLACWGELRSLSLRTIKFGGARGFDALFESSMLDSLAHLCIEDIPLDNATTRALFSHLERAHRLESLELERVRLSNAQLEALLTSPIGKQLRALSLRDNNLDEMSCALLSEGPTLPRLERLFLGARVDSPYFTSRHHYYNAFGKRGFELLARNQRFPSLEGLELAYHNMTVEMLSLLTKANFPALCMLDVHNNILHRNGLIDFFHNPLASQLTHIDLSGNALDNDTLGALTTARREEPIRALLLNGIRLDLEGMRHLARAPQMRTLKRLELAENNLTKELLICFDEEDRFPELERLSIAGNKPPDHVTAAIIRSATAQHLTELDLRTNHIGAQSREALLTPGVLPKLQRLRLSPPNGKYTPEVYLAGNRLQDIIRYDYYSSDPTHSDLFSSRFTRAKEPKT